MSSSARCADNAVAATALLRPGRVDRASREQAARLLWEGCWKLLTLVLTRRYWQFDYQQCEEVASDAIMAFLKDPARSDKPDLWLHGLAKFKALDLLRRMRAQSRSTGESDVSLDDPAGEDEDGPSIDLPGPDDVEKSVADKRAIEYVLRRMEDEAPTYVPVLRMLAAGYDNDDIAEVLGISNNAARNRALQARRIAARLLGAAPRDE